MSIEVYIQHADFESDDNVIVEPNLVWPLIEEVDWSREREQMETLKADRKQFCSHAESQRAQRKTIAIAFSSASLRLCVTHSRQVPWLDPPHR